MDGISPFKGVPGPRRALLKPSDHVQVRSAPTQKEHTLAIEVIS